MSTSVGQALIAMLESDLVNIGGAPFETLLQSLKSANGNRALQAAAVIQFTAAAPAAGIQLELEVEQQLLTYAISDVQKFIAAKTTVAAAAK